MPIKHNIYIWGFFYYGYRYVDNWVIKYNDDKYYPVLDDARKNVADIRNKLIILHKRLELETYYDKLKNKLIMENEQQIQLEVELEQKPKLMTQEEVLNKIMQLASDGAKTEDKKLSEMIAKLDSIDAEFVYSILQKGNLEVVRALLGADEEKSEDLYKDVLELAVKNHNHDACQKLVSINVENNYSEYEESIMDMNNVHVMGDNNSLNNYTNEFINIEN